jgi:hypothetical protein
VGCRRRHTAMKAVSFLWCTGPTGPVAHACAAHAVAIQTLVQAPPGRLSVFTLW